MKKTIGFTKRVLAILLSSMLVAGTIPGTALASENEKIVVQEEEAVESYTVTLDANGGHFVNEWDDVLNEKLEETEILNKVIPVGGTVSIYPVYEQEDMEVTFVGWSLERDGEIVSREEEEFAPVEDCVLYAVWEYENNNDKELEEERKGNLIEEDVPTTMEEAAENKLQESNHGEIPEAETVILPDTEQQESDYDKETGEIETAEVAGTAFKMLGSTWLNDITPSTTSGYYYYNDELINNLDSSVYSRAVEFDASYDSYAVYELNKSYVTFTGTVCTGKSTGSGVFTISIYGDGELIHEISGVTNDNNNKSFNVDVTDVTELKIQSDNSGSWANGWVYIADGLLSVMGETVITLDPSYEGSPNKEFTISADVISKKVAPDTSNVTWTLTPSNGQEGSITWGSMSAITSGDNQYIISRPVTVSAVGEYNLVVSFKGASATAKVVIDSSLKARFPILRQNEMKEYYTYYNGSEMKPGFIAEMEGENVSLDRLTYHYEDNNKPGIAKLVIDTLDGDAVKCETQFLILPGIVEKPTVTSENAGEFTVSIKPVEGWKDYQIDVCDKYGSIDGYPKLIKTENINDEGVCIKYIGMLEMDQAYTIKIREVVLVDGILHGGGWSESVSKKTRKYEINKDFWRDVFEVNKWQRCSLDFGTGSLKYTGKGSIRIVEKGTQKEVYSYKLSDIKYNEVGEQVIEKDGVQLIVSRNGIQLTVNINAGAIKNTATYFHVKTGDSIIKPDTEYCIVIDPGSIQYCDYDPETGKEVIHDDAFIGIKEGSISVKTIPYALPTYRNPSDFPIDISFYNNLFGPSKGKKVRNYDDGQTGWCFGLSTAVSSYYRGNSGIKSIVDKKSLFTDVKMDTTGNNSVSFEEYVKYAQLYCYTPLVAKQRYNNKNKTSEIIRAVKNKEYPIICFIVFGGAGHGITERHGHAVTGLYVEEENDEKTVIRVYNSSTEKDGNRFTETLTINKDGSWTTQSGNYSSGPLNEISYFIFDETCEQDIMNVDNVAANNYLVFIKANAKPKGDGYRLGRFNGEVMDEPEEEGSYYWSESGIITIESGEINEDGEDREISIIDDNNITTFSFPSSSGIEINKPEGVFNIINNDDLHQSVKVTYEFWDDNDVASEIVIDAISYGNLEIVTDENSISLSGDDEKELSITATDENGNKRKVDVPQSLNDINITKGKKLIVSEDTTKDGNFDTLIAEETFTTEIASKDIILNEIPDQIYTGRKIQPECFLKLGDDILIRNTDYTVDYSNNINAGTATVTITGKGNYTGTKTATFKINKANQSISVKSTASSIAVGKTATVLITGAKGTKSYKSSNTAIATVNASTGVVTGKKAGTVTITATSAATSNYNAASKAVKITVTADKTLKKPGNCHFVKWNNKKFTSCQIAWNKVAGAEGYQTLLSWTDGSHASSTYTKSNVLYRNCTVHPQHVSQMKVRAYYTAGGKRVFGPWSNVEYITPSPTTLTAKNASVGSNLKMNVSWNIIYGCNGYNVFITTNPNGKWYWYQSTAQNATAKSSVITKCGGAKLKKNTRYYVRIVTRRKRNGVFCTVPMPANNVYTGTFIIK